MLLVSVSWYSFVLSIQLNALIIIAFITMSVLDKRYHTLIVAVPYILIILLHCIYFVSMTRIHNCTLCTV